MGIKDIFKKKKAEEKAAEKPLKKEPEKKLEVKKALELKKVKVDKEDTGDAYKILIKPVVTEKATYISSLGQYVFAVNVRASSAQIKRAIRKVYGVTPISVNIINNPGKKVKWGRSAGKRNDWKKAIVSLRSGEKINLVEGV